MTRAKTIYAALAIACMGTPAFAGSVTLDIQKLEAASVADLEAAQADASAHGDTIAQTCYAGIETYVKANPITVPAAPVGVASAFQTGRDAVKLGLTAASNGIPQPLELACGPLALDVQSDLGRVVAPGFSIFGLKF